MKDSLVERYAEERQKRLRRDGNAQYVDLHSTDLQDLAEDPWADHEAIAKTDGPLHDGDNIKFLITGAGHNGILFAARLIDAGFSPKDIVLVDVAGGYGGTWYWNRYPGLMCDVEGYCYLPLLEETGYIPKHKYSYGAEIRHNANLIAARYGFQGMFCTKVDNYVWNDAKGCWIVKLTQSLGRVRPPTELTVKAKYVFIAGGILDTPKVPNVPGFTEFRKNRQVFHTSRWDYTVTGGSQEQPAMTKLQNKTVAIVGTGATSVQAVPELAKWAKHLYVVQRTPSYCGERAQKPTTAEDWAKVADGPGWQARRCANLNSFISAEPEPIDLVNDGWSHNQARAGLIGGNPGPVDLGKPDEHINRLLEMDRPIAEELRARVDKVVKDADVAEKLKPWYPGWCKRPTFNDDYLETFNRSNVTLLDTDGKGIERFTERGVLVGGQEIEVDVLVLGTGFLLSTLLTPSDRLGAPILGRGSRNIDDKWLGSDTGTLFGIAMHGFPNMFGFFSSGGGGSYNQTSMYDVVASLTAYVVAEASRQSSDPEKLVIEPSADGEEKWTSEVAKRAAWYSALTICTPSYFTMEGKATTAPTSPEEAILKAKNASWGGGPYSFTRIVEDYMRRTENKLEGFLVREVSA